MRVHSCVKLSLALLFVVSLPLLAQDEKGKDEKGNLEQTIQHEDGMFWDAYNRCDVDRMSQFFWPDIEFYHDKGGPTIGLGPFAEALKTGLCGNPNFRLRREAIPETVKFFLLRKSGTPYGAVLSGEHYFYINDTGKPEYRDGVADFFHVWLVKDGTWKMARVISYNHHEPPNENKRKEITLAPDVMGRYVGKYDAPKTGTLVLSRDNDRLILTAGGKKYVLHPEAENVFFTTDRDLTFEFIKEGTRVSKIVVREHGAITEEAKAE